MKEIDDNLKARFADYLNGKAVKLSDEELEMLSEDDNLAAECLEIAEISSDYEAMQVKKSVKSFKLNVLFLSVAACLLAVLVVTVFYENDTPTAVSTLNPNAEPQKGWGELSGEAGQSVKTASANSDGFYTAAPGMPFEVEPARQNDIYENDTVKIYTADNPTPIMITKIENGKVKFEDGLAEGLYEYRVFHDSKQVDQGGIVIGEE